MKVKANPLTRFLNESVCVEINVYRIEGTLLEVKLGNRKSHSPTILLIRNGNKTHIIRESRNMTIKLLNKIK